MHCGHLEGTGYVKIVRDRSLVEVINFIWKPQKKLAKVCLSLLPPNSGRFILHLNFQVHSVVRKI